MRYSTIYCLDVNDNAPKFENLPYRAEVKEVSDLEFNSPVFPYYSNLAFRTV